MHRSPPVLLKRWAAPASFSVALLIGACTSDDPASPGPGAGGSAGKANVGGAGGSGAGVGGTGGSPGTGGTGGGAGQLSTGGAGAAGGTGGTSGTGGAGGTTGGAGGGGNGGMPPIGGAGTGTGGAGASGGGTPGSGGLSGSAGTSGGAGAQGGTGPNGWTCPSGVTGMPMLSGTPTRIMSVPPHDAFNQDNGNFGNIEGPLWIDDALYVSEMSYMAYGADSNVKQSRILKVTPAGQTTIFIADSGSNGHAVDADGNIIAAVHKDGSITRFTMPAGTPATPIVTKYMNARFDSPNDLVIHSNGTIYFSDPNFQAPNSLPQSATRVYRIPPGGEAEPIPSAGAMDSFGNPNGVTLSLAEDYLYVAASVGRRYPVLPDGTLSPGENWPATNGGDGLTIDCAGNLYVAKEQSVAVFTPTGTSIGSINVPDVQSVTNVAFGGADHKTLYITGLGNNKGLFQITLSLPGRPY